MPSREYYLKGREDKQLLAYETLAREVALKFGANPNRTKKEMREMVDFEVQLANVSDCNCCVILIVHRNILYNYCKVLSQFVLHRDD